jgi:hypothetical protein
MTKEEIKLWVHSAEGSKVIEKALKESKEFDDELDEICRFDVKILREPITL